MSPFRSWSSLFCFLIFASALLEISSASAASCEYNGFRQGLMNYVMNVRSNSSRTRDPASVDDVFSESEDIELRSTGGNRTLDGHSIETGDGGDDSDDDEAFKHVYKMLVFLAAVWLMGKAFAWLGTPALVGEIVVGIILGPQLVNLAPEFSALMLFGEIGLTLLIIEAGLHVDVEMLQIVGLRALAVGLVGSLVPMACGVLVAELVFGCSHLEAFAVGATMATMSTGIALNVLQAGGVLNQPTGQLIIAAATVNEMVNISLLTELNAIKEHGEWPSYVLPLVIMLVLVIVIGFFAIEIVPWLLRRVVFQCVREEQREIAVLVLVFAMGLVFQPLCHYTGSSELLGAFLAGFCFCTDHHVHDAWNHKVKRVAEFLMRLFFACSIGFTIPILEFADSQVWIIGAALLLCMALKIAAGIFASPLNCEQFCTLGFAWGAFGEFSFILALNALDGGLIKKEMYNGVVLAVLISVLVCPFMLRRTLDKIASDVAQEVEEAKHDTADTEVGEIHYVYYCLQTLSHARWGQQSALLSAISDANCKIIDFRAFHPCDHVGAQHVINELYLKDKQLKMKLSLDALASNEVERHSTEKLEARKNEIYNLVVDALHDTEPTVKISRWLPGHAIDEQDISQEAHNRITKKHSMPLALDRTTLPLTPRVHHELDGFVHTCEHDAFPDILIRERSEVDEEATTSSDEIQRSNTW